KRAMRSGAPLSLAILDVDYFKKFNDTYGHARGDDCLRAIAQALLGVTRRPPDLAARYGGEEFAIVLPETDSDAMHVVLAHLLEGVRALAVEHRASSCANHVKIGRASCRERESNSVGAGVGQKKRRVEKSQNGMLD